MKKCKVLFIMLMFMLFFSLNINIIAERKTFTDYTIFIDAGHGGYDGGAKGRYGSVEKEINLAIALNLANYLQQVGFEVHLSRDKDVDLVTSGSGSMKKRDLDNRIEMINNSDCDFFVSIHMNSMPDERWNGAQTFYYDRYDSSKVLAECIQKSLREVLQNTKREAKVIRNLYLFKMVDKPGVLVEAGFLSNIEEESLLKQEKYQDLVAFSIYLGILKCIENN